MNIARSVLTEVLANPAYRTILACTASSSESRVTRCSILLFLLLAVESQHAFRVVAGREGCQLEDPRNLLRPTIAGAHTEVFIHHRGGAYG